MLPHKCNFVYPVKIITVKFRAGIVEGNLLATDFAKRMEDAGASLITVHGRTREGMYSGPVHFDEIASVVKAVNIPVIANGGIFSEKDADYMLENTGAAGVGIARGALSDPLLFAKLSGKKSDMSIKDCAFYLMDLRKNNAPDKVIAHAMRKFCVQFLKGVRGGKEAKLKIFEADSTQEIKDILDKARDDMFEDANQAKVENNPLNDNFYKKEFKRFIR